jgi:hypothetical protein
MTYALPVPPTVPDVPDATGSQWEAAQPTADSLPQLVIGGGSVVMYRTGPGDVPYPRDEWMGISVRDVPRPEMQTGRENFVEIPGPPPEGHQGYDFPDEDLIINRSRQNQALFWSDFYGSTAAQAGGGGSFRGAHVTITRIPPGSQVGYMPTDPGMVQFNMNRGMPGPWDSNLILGTATPLDQENLGSQNMGAAVSM